MKNKTIFKINIIYFIALLSVATIFALGYLGLIEDKIISSFLIQIVVVCAIPLLLHTIFVSKNLKKSFSDTGFKKISFKIIIFSIILGFVLYFINSFVSKFFSGLIAFLGYETIGSTGSISLSYEFLLKELILTCILPAICEEFLHRGIMLHAQKQVANTRYCLLVSSILFGFMHLNINQFFYAAILGYLMGYVTLVANSIYPSIIIHFMNNFLSSYFYYGRFLNWPLANLVHTIEMFLASNLLLFTVFTVIGITILSFLFVLLTRKIKAESSKKSATEQAENAVNNQTPLPAKHSPTFAENIFLISSLVFGCLITISSFIWGII